MKKRRFTFNELIVVVCCIAVLAALVSDTWIYKNNYHGDLSLGTAFCDGSVRLRRDNYLAFNSYGCGLRSVLWIMGVLLAPNYDAVYQHGTWSDARPTCSYSDL